MGVKVESYGLDPDFERAVVTALCQRPKLFGLVGAEIDPEAIKAKPGKLALETVKSYAAEAHKGPDSLIVVLQRLRRRHEEGRVTQEEIEEVNDYFDEAIDAGLPGDESLLQELVPVLQQRMQDDAVLDMLDAQGKRQDLTGFAKRILSAEHLGKQDSSLGVKIGEGSFDAMEAIRHLDRLPFDVPEIDQATDGGLPRGCLGVAIADSGGGKSMFLSHMAGVSCYKGMRVAYATLELPEPMVLARIKANITGIPVNAIANSGMDTAKAQIEKLAGRLGPTYVNSFTPHATELEHVTNWVDAIEQAEGEPIHLLVVDYADKMSAGKKTDESSYTAGRVVYEGLRIWADERKTWCWTASQSTRKGKDSGKRLDIHHTADSMHKVRVADLVITLNLRDEGESLMYYIAKNRYGPARQEIGPLPQDWMHGRTADTVRGYVGGDDAEFVDDSPF